MIIGAAVIAISISVTADDTNPLQRINKVEAGSEDGNIGEPIIEEVTQEDLTEDLIIAPNPDATITHYAEDGERTIENTQIIDEPRDEDHKKEMIDSESTLIATFTDDGKTKNDSAIPAILVIGAAAIILTSLIFIRRNQK